MSHSDTELNFSLVISFCYKLPNPLKPMQGVNWRSCGFVSRQHATFGGLLSASATPPQFRKKHLNAIAPKKKKAKQTRRQ